MSRIDVVFEAQLDLNVADPSQALPYEKVYRLTVFDAADRRLSAIAMPVIDAYPGQRRRVRQAEPTEKDVIHLILAEAERMSEALRLAVSTPCSLLALAGQNDPIVGRSNEVVVFRSAGDEAVRLALGLSLPKESLICVDFADVAATCRRRDVVVSAIPAENVRCELAAMGDNPTGAWGFLLFAPGLPLLELDAIFDVLRKKGELAFQTGIFACDSGLAPDDNFLFALAAGIDD